MDSKEYWEKREAEALNHRITEEEAYDKELEKIYQNMLDNCQKEIDAFYGKYAKQESISLAESKKRVSELDIKAYERKAKRYVKEKDFSKEANEEMRLYNLTMKVNRLEMLKANIGLELISGHDELQKFMGKILKGRTEDELKRQAGILGKTVRNNAKLAHTIPYASFHNATFSNRIWMYQDLLKADLEKLLSTGLIQGKNARTLAKELRGCLLGDKYGSGAVYNMERLMRTELARVQTEAQRKSFEKNGFEFYRFIHNHNGTRAGNDTCADCVRVATTDNGNGEGVYRVADMMPGTNAPPMHPHCRCSTAAYEDSDEYEAWLDYLDKGGTTEEWNKFAKTEWENELKNIRKDNIIEFEDKGDLYTDLGSLSDNTMEASLQINNFLNTLGLPESKWSGKTILKKTEEMLQPGKKKKSCDIWLRENAPIKTIIHEHLHARSSSRMEKRFPKDRCFEEGACELLAEEICKKNDISYRATYKEFVEPLRKFNKINGKHASDYEFAIDFFNVDLDKREKWLEDIAEQSTGIQKIRLKNQIKKMREGNE